MDAHPAVSEPASEIVERINGQTTAAGFAAGYRKAAA